MKISEILIFIHYVYCSKNESKILSSYVHMLIEVWVKKSEHAQT